jgi:hypothetical protein
MAEIRGHFKTLYSCGNSVAAVFPCTVLVALKCWPSNLLNLSRFPQQQMDQRKGEAALIKTRAGKYDNDERRWTPRFDLFVVCFCYFLLLTRLMVCES